MVVQICGIIGNVIGVSGAGLAIDSSIYNTNGWDSMATLNIFLDIEARFGISISIDDGEYFQKVSDITELLLNKYLVEEKA